MKKYPDSNTQSPVVSDLFYAYKLGAKPFLKWVGGKRQLLSQFEEMYPIQLKVKAIDNYYEPFVGGGAVFFDVVQNYEIKNAFLYDVNPELILTYLVIQRDVYSLLEVLEDLDKRYKGLTEEGRTTFFYDVRLKFNQNRHEVDFDRYSDKWILRAAQTIFLNKTCFNGLFRFNSKGEFNSPVGRYSNPKILDEQNLLNVSKLLEIATIKRSDFSEIRGDITDSSFVYFDPPYRPLNKTSRFTSYSKSGFSENDQLRLAELFHDMDREGHLLMLSNSDPKNVDESDSFFDDVYSKFRIQRVVAKRSINSVANGRKAINEIVITNY